MTPNLMDLVIAFPPSQGFRGACTTIRDISRIGLYEGHLGLTPTKQDAVRLVVAVNLTRDRGRGRGMKARLRAAAIIGRSLRRARSPFQQRALDAEAEALLEGRIHRNTRPQRHE